MLTLRAGPAPRRGGRRRTRPCGRAREVEVALLDQDLHLRVHGHRLRQVHGRVRDGDLLAAEVGLLVAVVPLVPEVAGQHVRAIGLDLQLLAVVVVEGGHDRRRDRRAVRVVAHALGEPADGAALVARVDAPDHHALAAQQLLQEAALVEAQVRLVPVVGADAGVAREALEHRPPLRGARARPLNSTGA